MELRPYQRRAVSSVWSAVADRTDNPCVVIPTGGGKTPVIATLCRDVVGWQGRVLVLSHVRELLQQSVDTLAQWAPDLADMVGVNSAGLGSRDLDHQVLVAGVQSVYRHGKRLGHVDIAIVDEAHLIPPSGEGMYRRLLAALLERNPLLRVVGMTATPYRSTTGPICTDDGILNRVCFEVGVRDLIDDGYLCRLVSRCGSEIADTSSVSVRGGEFAEDQLARLMDTPSLVESTCADLVKRTEGRRSVLVFGCGVHHAMHIATVLARSGAGNVRAVFGDTDQQDRDDAIAAFQAGDVRYLVNMNVLTTGFDAPNIDAIALVRPTMSPGLYYQMVGRGLRTSPDKRDCLVLDYGGNILRHGPIDAIDPSPRKAGDTVPRAKTCPTCETVLAVGEPECQCGHAFERPEPREITHDVHAADAPILSEDFEDFTETMTVAGDAWDVHTKRGAGPDDPKTMRVTYRVASLKSYSEWVCVEHAGYAGRKAAKWWAERSRAPMPITAADAVNMARAGALATTRKITVEQRATDKYPSIVAHELGERPDWREPGEDGDYGDGWLDDARQCRQSVELIERSNGSVTVRDWQRTRSHRTAEAADAELAQLVAAGVGRWEQVAPGPKGGRPSKRFILIRHETIPF